MYRVLFALVALLSLTLSAPMNGDEIVMLSQPDGSEVPVRLFGDEFYNLQAKITRIQNTFYQIFCQTLRYITNFSIQYFSVLYPM